MTSTQTVHDDARTNAADAASALVLRAAETARKHRYELLILAGTVAFVAIVALLSVAALFG